LVRLAEITTELEIQRAKLDKLQDEHAAARESLAERAKQVEILTSQVSDQLIALERAASQRDALQSEARRSAVTVADLSARIEAEETNVTEKLKTASGCARAAQHTVPERCATRSSKISPSDSRSRTKRTRRVAATPAGTHSGVSAAGLDDL
jgi:chromosome segregation ATPase